MRELRKVFQVTLRIAWADSPRMETQFSWTWKIMLPKGKDDVRPWPNHASPFGVAQWLFLRLTHFLIVANPKWVLQLLQIRSRRRARSYSKNAEPNSARVYTRICNELTEFAHHKHHIGHNQSRITWTKRSYARSAAHRELKKLAHLTNP